jgi:hypothetical protein
MENPDAPPLFTTIFFYSGSFPFLGHISLAPTSLFEQANNNLDIDKCAILRISI